MPWTAPKTFNTGDVLPASDLNTHLRDNLIFLHDKGADVAASNSITTLTTAFHKITGNTQINTITPYAAGARLVLWFTGTPLLKHNNGGSGSLLLAANADYTASVNEILMFMSDGTNWYELGRDPVSSTQELGYTQFTANVTVSGATEAAATTIVTAPAITFDGATLAIIEFFSPAIKPAAGDIVIVCLFMDGSTLGLWGEHAIATNTTYFATLLRHRKTPASGSRTFSARAYRNTTNGTVLGGLGGATNELPGYIRVTKGA